jgi:hypothetical protein
MASYNPHSTDLTAYTYSTQGHWNEQSVLHPYQNDITGTSSIIYYAHPQVNTDTASFSTTAPPFALPFNPYPPLPLSSIVQPSIVSRPTLGSTANLYSYAPLPSWNMPTHHPPSNPIVPHSTSTMTNIPTTSHAIPTVVRAMNVSERARFPCLSCGKLWASRPRAFTCFCNHIDAKPFVCNGDCGIVGW